MIDEQTPLLLAQGQIWQLTESNIHIGMIGKTLVHYKHFRGGAKRANNEIISIRAMKEFLANNSAVLQKNRTANFK